MSCWYSELLLLSLLSVTVMLNAMAFSVVERDTIQISYRSGLCMVWELTAIICVMEHHLLSTQKQREK